MFYKSKWNEKQLKENRIAHQKKIDAEQAEAIKNPSRFKRSFSSTHPAYCGTVLCSDPNRRGKKND